VNGIWKKCPWLKKLGITAIKWQSTAADYTPRSAI